VFAGLLTVIGRVVENLIFRTIERNTVQVGRAVLIDGMG
jgi:hypothetical protein